MGSVVQVMGAVAHNRALARVPDEEMETGAPWTVQLKGVSEAMALVTVG
jgi:hypothetical protein